MNKKSFFLYFILAIIPMALFGEINFYEQELVNSIPQGKDTGELGYRYFPGSYVGIGTIGYDYLGRIVVIDNYNFRISFFNTNLELDKSITNIPKNERKPNYAISEFNFRISEDNNFYTYSSNMGIKKYNSDLELIYWIQKNNLPKKASLGEFWLDGEFLLLNSENGDRIIIDPNGRFLNDEERSSYINKMRESCKLHEFSDLWDKIKGFLDQNNLFIFNDSLFTNNLNIFIQYRELLDNYFDALTPHNLYKEVFSYPNYSVPFEYDMNVDIKCFGLDSNGNKYFWIPIGTQKENVCFVFTKYGEIVDAFEIPIIKNAGVYTVLPSGDLMTIVPVFENAGLPNERCVSLDFWRVKNVWNPIN